MGLENLKKLAHIRKTLNKLIKELQDLEKPAYTQRILSKLGKEIKSSFSLFPKVLAFVILVDISNFNSLYTIYIANKLIPVTRREVIIEIIKKLKEVYINL